MMSSSTDPQDVSFLINAAARSYGALGRICSHDIFDRPLSEASVAHLLRIDEDACALMQREILATSELHRAIREQSGHDSLGTWLATSLTKRILYISLPAVVLDPLTRATFARNGVNGRIHLLQAQRPQYSVRLEAVCTFSLGAARARYAIAIYYVRAGAADVWQIVRPAILVDPGVRAMFSVDMPRERARLVAALQLLAIIASQGIHDYLHGTMMRWFAPPTLDCAPAYQELLPTQCRPESILEWQRAADGGRSGPLFQDRFCLNADPLEHWSLIVHARNAAYLMDRRPEVAVGLERLVEAELAAVSELLLKARAEAHKDALALLGALSLFFYTLIMPVPHRQLSRYGWLNSELSQYARALHGRLVEKVHAYDSERFVWNEETVELFDVLRQYSARLGELRRPDAASRRERLMPARRF